MKKGILLVLVAFAVASCQPCETTCNFKQGDEVTIKIKSFTNNNGIIYDVGHHTDCSCYYTVSHSNMLNFVTYRDYDEFELKER